MDAEEFHKSRRRGSGRGEEARGDDRDVESESQQLRRRSYVPGDELVDADAARREARADGGGGDVKKGREQPILENKSGERRDGEGDDESDGSPRRGHEGTKLPNASTLGGGGGACAECGRCNCCGKPLVKEAFDGGFGVAGETKDVSNEGGKREEGSKRGIDGDSRGALGRTGNGTGESRSERHHRQSPELRRDHDLGARRRDGGEGFGHEAVGTGHRSEPSAGRWDEGFARRRRRLPMGRQDDRREDDRHRHRPSQRRDGGRHDDRRRHGRDDYGDRPQGHVHGGSDRHHQIRRDEGSDGHRRSEVRKGGRRQRLSPGYSSDDLSSEEGHVSPRRRRARREAAAAAVVANSAREDALRVSLGKKGELGRRRRRERHSSGEGNAAFSTPLSTPRRGQPAAAPPIQNPSTWRGGRRGRGVEELGRNVGGDSPALDYPTLPPSALPDARLRRGRNVGGPPDAFGDRRGAGRRSKEVRW